MLKISYGEVDGSSYYACRKVILHVTTMIVNPRGFYLGEDHTR